MLQDELMLMIAEFLHGKQSAEQFSFDFPARLAYVYSDLKQENPEFAQLMEDDMPELCASFDPHNTGDPDTIDEKSFRAKVTSIYVSALNQRLRKTS